MAKIKPLQLFRGYLLAIDLHLANGCVFSQFLAVYLAKLMLAFVWLKSSQNCFKKKPLCGIHVTVGFIIAIFLCDFVSQKFDQTFGDT